MIVFLGDLLGVLFFRMGCPSMVLVPVCTERSSWCPHLQAGHLPAAIPESADSEDPVDEGMLEAT